MKPTTQISLSSEHLINRQRHSSLDDDQSINQSINQSIESIT